MRIDSHLQHYESKINDALSGDTLNMRDLAVALCILAALRSQNESRIHHEYAQTHKELEKTKRDDCLGSFNSYKSLALSWTTAAMHAASAAGIKGGEGAAQSVACIKGIFDTKDSGSRTEHESDWKSNETTRQHNEERAKQTNAAVSEQFRLLAQSDESHFAAIRSLLGR